MFDIFVRTSEKMYPTFVWYLSMTKVVLVYLIFISDTYLSHVLLCPWHIFIMLFFIFNIDNFFIFNIDKQYEINICHFYITMMCICLVFLYVSIKNISSVFFLIFINDKCLSHVYFIIYQLEIICLMYFYVSIINISRVTFYIYGWQKNKYFSILCINDKYLSDVFVYIGRK